MKIKFLGAAGTVTGSGYVVTSDSGQSILVDLGMFQSLPAIEMQNYKPIDFDFSKLSGAILTHAHLDHVGRLPVIFKHGFKGQVWMTEPTRDLAEIVLFDSAKIARQDDRLILYDRELVETVLKSFKTIGYNTEFTIGDFKITLHDAGHILGSASVEIVAEKRVVFSGDLGNPTMDLLPHAASISQADVVVLESTYGDRLHPTDSPIEALATEIVATESSNGTLLIPAFSLEKTQEILHWIKRLKKDRKIKPHTPVFLDSPMAIRATRVYQHYPKFFDTDLQMEFKNSNPFDFPGLEVMERPESRGLIEKSQGAKVIIAGSGMMMGGKILMHAARYLPAKSTRLFIIGYQGEGTLGREIMEGARSVDIAGSNVNIRAAVNHTDTMSSHADQSQLLDWLSNISGVKKVILTHGEDDQRTTLAGKIKVETVLPNLNQEVELDS